MSEKELQSLMQRASRSMRSARNLLDAGGKCAGRIGIEKEQVGYEKSSDDEGT